MKINRSALYAGLLAVLVGAGAASAQSGGGASGASGTQGAASNPQSVDTPGTEGSTGSGPTGTDTMDGRNDEGLRDAPADRRDGPAASDSEVGRDAQTRRARPWWKFWQRDRDDGAMDDGIETRGGDAQGDSRELQRAGEREPDRVPR